MQRASPFLIIAALCGCAQPSPRVEPGIPAAVPASVPSVPPDHSAVLTLPGAVCERARTGETILMVQTAVNKLFPRLEADPAYSGAWYEHAPCYRIVLAFKDGLARPWVVEEASPELRPYIAFAGAKYSRAESERARLEISAAVAAAGIRSVFFVGSPIEKFMIGVRTQADADAALRVIPDRYRADVSIFVGDIEPRPER